MFTYKGRVVHLAGFFVWKLNPSFQRAQKKKASYGQKFPLCLSKQMSLNYSGGERSQLRHLMVSRGDHFTPENDTFGTR